jgi:hypothetical protein
MAEKDSKPKKLSMASTKKELLEAYNEVLKGLQEKKEGELRAEEKREEKKAREVVTVAESLSAEGLVQQIGSLKVEIGTMLGRISDSLEKEVDKYRSITDAVRLKEKELQELYGIEEAAESLAALLESQKRKREEFEAEMAAGKEELVREIEQSRAEWERETKERERETKEWEAEEKQRRERARKEFDYTFAREKQLAQDTFEDEKARQEKELRLKKEEVEKQLAEREVNVAEREKRLAELEKRVEAFPVELETAVNNAVKETRTRIEQEAKAREDLLKKDFEGERNVLTTRIQSLEQTVKDQKDQLQKLAQQLEKSYQKVEDIAVKTVEGSAHSKTLADLRNLLGEQIRKQQQGS